MIKSGFIIMLVLIVMNGTECLSQTIASRIMREQADSFLRMMPDSLQFYQAQAVARAIEGDYSFLKEVRSVRDKYPQISDNVSVKDLSPSLRLYEPMGTGERQLPLLIYFHGGGWTFGSINSCGRFCDAMAATGKMKVMAVNYRLAPENPYPSGYVDCINSVKYAIDNCYLLGINSISVGGDSSGGNLAIATALSSECVGKIASLVLFYPVTKAFADNSLSWNKYAKGYGLDAFLMEQFNKAYAPQIPSGVPQIDVGMASSAQLECLPRTLLIAAGRDILRDQGIEFSNKLSADKIQRIEFSDAVHLFITVPGQEKAFRSSVAIASEFITTVKSEY